jgi:Domain of unknown function (DUF4260)
MQPKILLHLEGGTLFAVSLILYGYVGGNWLLFLLLILAPDLSALGYLGGNTIGAYTYNTFHTYLLPAILAIYGLLSSNALALQIALIWFAHIGGDRLLGFGLKYPTAFKDTHLNRV